MEHVKCSLSTEGDPVYVAATAGEINGQIWWLFYRVVGSLDKETGHVEPEGIEVARFKPSCTNSMQGKTIAELPRFEMITDEHGVLTAINFPGSVWDIINPMNIFDYADQMPPLSNK